MTRLLALWGAVRRVGVVLSTLAASNPAQATTAGCDHRHEDCVDCALQAATVHQLSAIVVYLDKRLKALEP